MRSPYTKKAQGGGSCYSTVRVGHGWGVGLPVGRDYGENLGTQPPLLEWGLAAPRRGHGLGFSESHRQLRIPCLWSREQSFKSGQLGQGPGFSPTLHSSITAPRGLVESTGLAQAEVVRMDQKPILCILPVCAGPRLIPCSLKAATMLQVSSSMVCPGCPCSRCSFGLRFLPTPSVAKILEIHSQSPFWGLAF